ncbi:AAA domain-containing protein [Aminipila butyrica]|uniref:AAA domain-containing protein n=1 Tax=Aminipila butyrica TaxID=433296 RepID=A0A858BSM3_9FIRM|nr:sigma 54-interacting transcriptional regulator [Aminipila butyrica]QIB68209.1 AAA domain-containing protein [Aminipila butyrica]
MKGTIDKSYEEVAASIFDIQNFFDEISIIDMNGIIQYCKIFVPGVYGFTADEIIGKHIFEVFTTSSAETSEICQVLKSGKPISNFYENCTTYKGDIIKGYSSIYPIFRNKNQVGAAVALKFIDSDFHEEFIEIFLNNDGIRNHSINNYTIDDLITTNPYMLSIKNKVKKVAKSNSSVLIQGNTGTGKEIIAQSLHYASQRAGKPFISQNCSAIPASLLESTLFGTEKGSFTGAITNKGLFELADGGSLFLDEINSMELPLQCKILKAIEDKYIRRLGGHKNISVDIRIIAAINEDPFDAISKNRLRQDLFYRLNVVSIKLPDLKDRKDDVSLLTSYFIAAFNNTMGKNISDLHPSVEHIFSNHSWPGNVRELRNVIEGAFNLAEGRSITLDDIPDYIKETQDSESCLLSASLVVEDTADDDVSIDYIT